MRSSTIALACSVVTLSFFAATAVSTPAAAQQQKPNVVFSFSPTRMATNLKGDKE